MKASETAIELLKEFEGFSPIPYLCPAGKNSVGFGHVIREGELFDTLTEDQAIILLKADLKWVEKTLDSCITVDLTQNEIDALCSLVYNIGGTNFRNSTLLKLIQREDFIEASEEFLKWCKITDPKTGEKVTSQGLLRRRKAERALFIEE